MPRSRLRLALLIALPLLAVGLVAAYYAALQLLKEQITAALGSTGEVKALTVSLNKVELEGLRIRASRRDWPTADELRAERVSVVPDLRSLLSGKIVVSSISVENAALTVLRRKDGLKIIPALLDKPAAKPAPKPSASAPAKELPTIRVGSVRLINSRVDFFDATLGGKAQHIPMEKIMLVLDNIVLPKLDEFTRLSLQANIASQGRLDLGGKVRVADMESELKLKLEKLPLKLAEPWLFKGKAGEIKQGQLALNLQSVVSKRQLKAPGHMVLSNLELGGVSGLARQAAAAFARSKGLDADTSRPVDLDFTLQGNLDDAKFSLNEAIYAQGGMAALKLLGLNFGGSGNSGTQDKSGLGNMLKGLFGE